LDQLDDAGLLFRRGTAPHATYLFKHALVQDAAYSTLLRGRRQELHARVAAALEEHFPDLVERQPELLAHHLTAAGSTEQAVDQWLKAGRHAALQLAHVEAIAHLERGLVVLASLPEMPPRDAREIELRLALGPSLITVHGMSSPAVHEAYDRARELAEDHGDQRQLFQAIYGLWQHTSGSGRVILARPLSERLLRVAGETVDDGLLLQAHHSAWTTSWFSGDPAKTREHAEAGCRLYDPVKHAFHRFVYGGHDPGVCARMTGGQVEWLLGYPDKALASSNEALVLAGQIAHPFSLEIANEYAALLYLYRGDPELAYGRVAAAEALRAEQRVASAFRPAILRGAVQVERGSPTDALASLREGLAPETGGSPSLRPYGLCLLTEALLSLGNYVEALSALSEAFEHIEATGERTWLAELHRLRGLVLLAQNKLDEGGASLTQAIHVAQAQQAKSLELRAARELARLWGEQGRRAEARALLAPVYDWFTEGFDTPDLKKTKALLDELT
jgi:predicted ATPase